MARITFGNGRWFDTSRAKNWKEDTYWNGNNHISKATGSQWEHEELYQTSKGTFVLHTWSQWQGSSYDIIDEAAAHAWLIANGEADSVPASVLAEAEV